MPLIDPLTRLRARPRTRNRFRGLRRGFLACTAGWLVAAAGMASEMTIEPTAHILEVAERHLAAAVAGQHTGRTDIRMGRLDARLRLAKCPSPLQAFQTPGARLSGPTSVGVRCPDAVGWTVYVPANVDVFGTALVTARALAKGDRVTPSDVQAREVTLSRLTQGHVPSMADVGDRIMRRSVPVGTILTPAMLSSTHLIRRGNRVTLVNTIGSITVEMQGEAMGDAARGERVRVRALTSGEVVEGWAESASVVKVTL